MDDWKHTFAHYTAGDTQWTLRHLIDWYDRGSAPNDWDEMRLGDFWAWICEHAYEWPDNAAWPTMAAEYDRTHPRVSA